MNFENFIPKEHPTKQVFKDKEIPFAAIARALELSYGYTVDILNGTRSATPNVEAKLNAFAASLNKSKTVDNRPTPLLIVRIGINGIVNTVFQASNEDEQIAVQGIQKSIKTELKKINCILQNMAT